MFSYLVFSGCPFDDADRVEEALREYRRLRGVPREAAAADLGAPFESNLFELLAEDYRYLFTTSTEEHAFRGLRGYPSAKVKEFILGWRDSSVSE